VLVIDRSTGKQTVRAHYELPPEVVAAIRLAGEQQGQARALIAQGRAQEAIDLLRAAKSDFEAVGGSRTSAKLFDPLVADALIFQHRDREALAALGTPAIVSGSSVSALVQPIPAEQLAAAKAEGESAQAIAKFVKAGDFQAAFAECTSAMEASARVWRGGVPSPRLRYLFGSIYLAAGRYEDADRVFADIGRHNGEIYASDDFEMDVALVAAHLGHLRQAEDVVRRYLRRFHNWEGRAELLPGLADRPDAISSVRAVRGVSMLSTAQWAEAEGELRYAAQGAPRNAYIAAMRGQALAALGQFEEAKVCLDAAVRSDAVDMSRDAKVVLASVAEAAKKKKEEGK
jgi:tetratricopeptide (TPR) repeat protein